MTSVFLEMMNSHNLPVDKNISRTEAFAAVGVVADVAGVLLDIAMHVGWFDELITDLMVFVHFVMHIFMMGCSIFICVAYKAGAGDCNGYADTEFGDIKGADGLTGVRYSCGMMTATFWPSLFATIIFFLYVFGYGIAAYYKSIGGI
ncbi:hypothetical protein MAJ_05106, partial [Metarhizium majus ARSEF 297]